MRLLRFSTVDFFESFATSRPMARPASTWTASTGIAPRRLRRRLPSGPSASSISASSRCSSKSRSSRWRSRSPSRSRSLSMSLSPSRSPSRSGRSLVHAAPDVTPPEEPKVVMLHEPKPTPRIVEPPPRIIEPAPGSSNRPRPTAPAKANRARARSGSRSCSRACVRRPSPHGVAGLVTCPTSPSRVRSRGRPDARRRPRRSARSPPSPRRRPLPIRASRAGSTSRARGIPPRATSRRPGGSSSTGSRARSTPELLRSPSRRA